MESETEVEKTKKYDHLTDILLNSSKKFFLYVAVYLIGYWGFSVIWVVLLVVALAVRKNELKQKKSKWAVVRAMALGHEKEIILSKLQLLPTWVTFPDIERVEWLNRIIRQTWTSVDGYARIFIPSVIEPAVQSYLKGFKFGGISLGHVPLRIDGIKVYEEQDITTRDKIVMDVDISYAGNCKITFLVSGLKGGIENFQLRGKLRVVMKPLITKIPLIGGLQIYFMKEPEIDFKLVGVTQILGIPGLRSIIEKSVLDTINAMLLFPNIYPIKLHDEVRNEEITTFEAEGILRVHIVEAKRLVDKDITGKSDPYAVLSVGPQNYKTNTINNSLNPKWDEWCQFVVEANSELQVKVWDADDASKDESLGTAKIDVAQIAKRGEDDLWVTLLNVKHGMIHLRLTWLALSTSYADLDAALKETQLVGPYLASSLVVFYLDSIKNLPEAKAGIPPDAWVVIELEKTRIETDVIKHCANPAWEKPFSFLVRNPKVATLQVTIFDRKSGVELGEFDYTIENLKTQPELEFQNNSFVLRKSGPDCLIVCSLKLRIFRNDNRNSDAEHGEHCHYHEGEVKEHHEDDAVVSKRETKGLVKQESNASLKSNVSEAESNVTEHEVVPISILDRKDSIQTGLSIQITLRYSMQRQKLIVIVHQVTNIPVKHTLPDPYVKMYLLPGRVKENKRKTKIIKDSINPTYDETFEYLISSLDLKHSKLQIIVASEKRILGNTTLGSTLIDLNEYESPWHALPNIWFNLKPKSD